ncbi:hypothetical protein [Streptomyces sp. NPDC002962]|uniref:hypothetical protein n=1 Tax=Streptomyces sp. NPDC002962 TaxID=3364674 RepID=UPI00368A258E
MPSAPGNGFLKVDTTNLVRFKDAYVSGPVPEALSEADQSAQQVGAVQEITAFGLRQQGELLTARTAEHLEADRLGRSPAAGDPVPGQSPDSRQQSAETLLEVLIGRLEEAARRPARCGCRR